MTVFRRLSSPFYLLISLIAGFPIGAQADYHIRSPNEIDLSSWEFEHNGAASFDRKAEKNGESSETIEVGGGVTSWWQPEFELGFARQPGPDQRTRVDGVVWENVIRLTEPGENWADFGLYGEYAWAAQKGVANSTMFGPLIEKEVGPTTHSFNYFFNKNLGPNQDSHDYTSSYAWQSRWNLSRLFSPAVEFYADAGKLSPFGDLESQKLLAGPILLGSALLGSYGKVKYEVGPLFGLTNVSPGTTLRWRLEWEMHF